MREKPRRAIPAVNRWLREVERRMRDFMANHLDK